MKSIDDLILEYNKAHQKSVSDYQEWVDSQDLRKKQRLPRENYNESYKGSKLDYNYFSNELIAIIKADFNFTDRQAGYIYRKAYEDYHAYFSDIFYGTYNLARFVKEFPERP